MKVTKKEKQNTTNAKRGEINTKYMEMSGKKEKRQEEQTLFRIFLISDFRVSILPEFIGALNLNVLWFL